VSGISASTWYSDDKVDIAFREAVAASCQENVDYSDIEVSRVVDAVVTTGSELTPLSLTGSLRSGRLPVLAASEPGVEVWYLINQYIKDFNNTATANYVIAKNLAFAVENGYFTAYLRQFAVLIGTNLLASCSSTQVSVLSYSPFPTLAPTGHINTVHKLSDGSLAAIIVCSFIGAAFLGTLICCSAREESVTGKRNFTVVSAEDESENSRLHD
jgi:hypothetical protein